MQCMVYTSRWLCKSYGRRQHPHCISSLVKWLKCSQTQHLRAIGASPDHIPAPGVRIQPQLCLPQRAESAAGWRDVVDGEMQSVGGELSRTHRVRVFPFDQLRTPLEPNGNSGTYVEHQVSCAGHARLVEYSQSRTFPLQILGVGPGGLA